MEHMINSYNPILVMLAIILTFMSAYTALDLFTLLHSSERNKRFLFLGGSFSMGIGIWVMEFIGSLASNISGSIQYNIPVSFLSIIIGISFTGIAFYTVTGHKVKVSSIITGSFFMTLAVLSIHVLGMYGMNFAMEFNRVIFAVSSLFIFGAFFLSLWMLFYSKTGAVGNPWMKPISSLIITGAIIEGYFLLNRSSSISVSGEAAARQTSEATFIMYLVIILSILILVGLVGSSTLISKRLAVSDTNLKDIKSALDEAAIVAITDPKGIITYVNDQFLKISKYEEHELVGQGHRILNSGYHSKEFFKELWKTIGNGHVWKGEIRNKANDGTYYWVDTTIVPFLNKKGKPYQYVAIRTDITDRKTAEEELTNTLKDLSDIKFALDQSSIVAFTDEKGIITNVNDKFCQISKYHASELIGQDHSILNSGYHSKEFFKMLWKAIGQGSVWTGEIRNKAKDGTYYWVDTTIIPFLNDNGKPYQYLAIRNDITERKKTEEILHRQDKLAAVGQLAAGVAHEIRNPLTSMKGYTEFLLLDETKEERKEFLDIILDEIERVNSIVEEFMVLAKPKTQQLEEKNIIPIIQNVLSLLEFEARKKQVHLHFDYNEDIIQIECDENRLKQVFLNFVKNGIEAMPNGGELRVSAIISDQNIHVSFKDTGVGIPPDKLKKLGEPFYTTKENGNGLGLMVSFKIIENHKGKVYIESEENKGTTFNIFLPAKTA